MSDAIEVVVEGAFVIDGPPCALSDHIGLRARLSLTPTG